MWQEASIVIITCGSGCGRKLVQLLYRWKWVWQEASTVIVIGGSRCGRKQV